MLLIIGLGNPGEEYNQTRHNIGFRVIDEFLEHRSVTCISKASFKGELQREDKLLFLKPTTFMNLSGESALQVSLFFKPTKILVIHDDLDLLFGSVRLKFGGGSGGHNGLKSLDQHLKDSYYRVRVGIGRPSQDFDTADYVLAKFDAMQEQILRLHTLPHIMGLLENFVSHAMSEDFAWERFVSRYSFKSVALDKDA